jgi:hypothetical protein
MAVDAIKEGHLTRLKEIDENELTPNLVLSCIVNNRSRCLEYLLETVYFPMDIHMMDEHIPGKVRIVTYMRFLQTMAELCCRFDRIRCLRAITDLGEPLDYYALVMANMNGFNGCACSKYIMLKSKHVDDEDLWSLMNWAAHKRDHRASSLIAECCHARYGHPLHFPTTVYKTRVKRRKASPLIKQVFKK